jgi:WD40 repeat protein
MPGEGSSHDGVADPRGVSTRQEFAAELSLLKDHAGLTVRDVARKIGVPVSTLGGYFGGSHLPPVKLSDLLPKILAICGVDDPPEVESWLAALARVRRAPGRRPANALVPYRGLKSFQPEDAAWFFGRQRLTDILVSQMRDQYHRGGLLAVVGPSGSGKSSLLRAGLIPAIGNGALDIQGVKHWPMALFTPGAHPMGERSRHQELASAGDQLPAAVVVDQFEEVFTLCQDEEERRAFITALCAAGRGTGPGGGSDPGRESEAAVKPTALIVLGLRADFYPHALRYPELVAELQRRQVLVGPMTEEELRSAITGPARKAGLDIEAGLVEVLLRDLAPADRQERPAAAHEPGTLPLLSHALLATWELSRGGRLTVADYRAGGGIHDAVAASAEEVYAGLTPAQQDLTRRIFTRLVHVADDTADTRRRVSRSELQLGDSDSDVQPVLDAFIGQRLITADTDTVEIAHEALLHAWPRLRHWIDADTIGARTHRQLTAAAEGWRDSDRDPSALYRGGRLAAAEEWASASSHSDDLNLLERAFLNASILQREQAERASRRQANRLRAFSAALAALLIVAASLAGLAYQQRSSAVNERDVAISRQLAIEASQLSGTDIALAMQLSLAAYEVAPTAEATSSLLNSTAAMPVTRLLGPAGTEMHSVAFSPDAAVLATGSGDGSVRLWDVGRIGRPAQLGVPLAVPGAVTSLAFSSDGKTLAVGSRAGGVTLWDVSNPHKPVLRNTFPGSSTGSIVTAVAFSPNGPILSTGSADGKVQLWDVTNPARSTALDDPLDAGTGEVDSVAFSPSGQVLAAGMASGQIAAWTVPRSGERFGAALFIKAIAHGVNAIAFSPDSTTLAAAGNDSMVRLWTISLTHRKATELTPLTGPKSWIYALAFSPDGHSIAAGSADDNAYIWDLNSGSLTAKLPQPAPLTSLAYGPDGDTLATGDADDIARIWTLPGPVLTGASGSVFAVAFSPTTGSTGSPSGGTAGILAVGSAPPDGRGQVQLWNVANPDRPVALGPPLTAPDPVDGTVAYGPGGRLAAGSGDGAVQLWDVHDAAHPVRLPSPSSALKTAIQNVAFDGTGQLLAAGSTDGTIELWDTATFTKTVPLAVLSDGTTGPSAQDAFAVAFSPDGQLLAAANADGTVRLWDIADPARPRQLGKSLVDLADAVYQVTFSPDGHLLAASGEDGMVRLWDVATPSRPRLLATLSGTMGIVYDVMFSPDGSTLATADGDKTVALWNIANPARPSRIASLTGPTGTVFAAVFSPDGTTIAAGSQDGITRLWSATPAAAAKYVCGIAGTAITAAEWSQYVPGLPYAPPCR